MNGLLQTDKCDKNSVYKDSRQIFYYSAEVFPRYYKMSFLIHPLACLLD